MFYVYRKSDGLIAAKAESMQQALTEVTNMPKSELGGVEADYQIVIAGEMSGDQVADRVVNGGMLYREKSEVSFSTITLGRNA